MCLQCQWPGWLLYFCVDMACVHEGKLEADGGQGERHALGFRRGGGALRRGAVYWLKTAIALLHDWAFVTAIVLPATSARDSVLRARQLAINHL